MIHHSLITYLVYILYLISYIPRKLRDEYDKLEGALKKLGVDPECVVTEEDEEEDGYNAESDLEEELERDTEREVATFVPSVYSLPCAQTSSRQQPVTSRLLDRVDEVLTSSNILWMSEQHTNWQMTLIWLMCKWLFGG